MPDNDSTLAK
jgi:hypothetical protein